MSTVAFGSLRRARPLNRDPLERFARPYLAPLGLSAALSFAATALELARPWPLKLAVDYAVGHHGLPGWLGVFRSLSAAEFAAVAGLMVICLVAAGGILTYLADFLVGSTAERIGADVRAAVFGHLQRLSLRFHDQSRTGDVANRLTSDVARVQDALVARFETLLPDLLMLLGMVVVLLLVNLELGLVALAVIPPLTGIAALNRRRIKSAQRHTRSLYGSLADRATEILSNVRLVQAFAREADETARFRDASDAMAASAVRAVKIEARFTPVSDFVLAAGGGLVLWLGVVQVARGELTVGSLLVVLSYTSSLYQPIRSLARLSTVLARGAVSRERLVEVLDADDIVRDAADAEDALDGAPRVELRGVDFGYAAGAPVLSGLDLQVRAGEKLCVVGASGAGKSTLLGLLLRLYDPDAGAITLDGVDLRQLKLSSLRERIALIPQDAWVIDGSIAENIAFGRRDASARDLREAARLALVDEFADQLPAGFDTIVGERGTLLSGGQRRRIAVARAIVRGASLLLFDEPTSGLDPVSERIVIEALQRVSERRTVVIVTHSPSLLAIADRIVVLDSGRITGRALNGHNSPTRHVRPARRIAVPTYERR